MENKALKVGDVLVSSWGYEQTNVDFYEVVKVLPKSVRLQQIGSHKELNNAYMSAKETPNPEKKIGDVFTRRVFSYDDTPRVRICSFAIAKKWEGKPETSTSYA